MQARLRRSSTESLLAGVCGGLGEYFHIDPVVIRMIFVLVTITSGLGLPVYLVLWLVMPKAPPRLVTPINQSHAPIAEEQSHAASPWSVPHEVRRREPLHAPVARQSAPPMDADQPPPPEDYRFDPLTGERIVRETPAIGATVDLSRDQSALAAPPAQTSQVPDAVPQQRRKRIGWLGVVLVTFGVVLLAEQLGIDPDIMFPIIMVGAGLLLLLRRR
jgi:phage shock protein C